jgi:hypothetical protein
MHGNNKKTDKLHARILVNLLTVDLVDECYIAHRV